jgi:divalent metal cation (Fe/Co/Zn/Cd) transporter
MLILFSDPHGEIMDEHVHDDLIEKIRATSNQVEGIIDTENASSVKAMKYHVDLHAIVNAMITVKKDTI